MKISRAARLFTALVLAVAAAEGSAGSEQSSSTPAAQQAPGASPATQAATAASPRGDWIAYNGPLGGDRFSPLAQITTSNVGQLRQACAFDTPDTVSFQTGIVAVGGTLNFTAFGNTYAIDGATCQQKWKHSRTEPANMLMANRGVGYSDGKLFRGTGDGHALALDATTGALLWDVTIADPKKGESVPMAPIAWSGLVFLERMGDGSRSRNR